jgi:protein O-GlcNAc transferase
LAKTLEEAHDLGLYGDRRRAVKAYERYLELDPSNVEALNGLGACLAEIGNNERATQVFELAYSLDDTFVPAMVNYGKLLAENNRGEEGLRILRRAKVAGPEFTTSKRCMPASACAWETQCGTPLPDAQLDGQLRQPAAGQLPPVLDVLRRRRRSAGGGRTPVLGRDRAGARHQRRKKATSRSVEPAPLLPLAQRRLRIGYWSPDFRSHSVRYFSRPVLDGHDHERVEIFLYHDFHAVDAHTDAQREKADHFQQVFNLTDGELVRLIRSHQLDVLVELAGHTSHNRASLLAHRMATVQLTGLGIHPPQGWAAWTARSSTGSSWRRRPEALLGAAGRAASSFWCFDPKEPIPLHPEPPSRPMDTSPSAASATSPRFHEKVARRWVDILDGSARQRLSDPLDQLRGTVGGAPFPESLQEWGLPMDRVDLRHPEGGVNFFASYGQVDIILDTFPFNGGTTTCFATFMAVPVVSMAGHSLVGRMGASVLGNVGASDLVVTTLDDYVRRAIELARDPEYLRRFKREIRARFEQAPLGNERLFARELEDACLRSGPAKAGRHPALGKPHRSAAGPGDHQAAYAVARRGNPDAARRIIDHCLSAYPDHGPAHLLRRS